jgi:hypothetical protein
MSVCPSVCMIQLENQWVDLYQIWNGHYAIADCLKVILFNLL